MLNIVDQLFIINIYIGNIMIPQEEETKEFEILKVNRYEVQENAIFLDYKVETLLSQIQKFSQNKFHVRLSLSKNLKTVEDVLVDHKQKFGQLLQNLSKDHEELQLQLLQYIKSKRPLIKLQKYLKLQLLKSLKNLANGPYLQIKQQSCELISELAHNLQVDKLQQIIEFGNKLAASDNEQNKIVAIQLLARLAPELPPKKRQSIFESQFLKIYSGSSVRVRKEIILQLGKLANNISTEFVDKRIVSEFYLKQTKDNAWAIRKACVEVITSLLVKVNNTKQDLCNVILGLLKDGNKFVRISAHKVIPQFIAKYGDKNISKPLFDVYLSLMDLDINNQVSRPNQIIEKIAFYFPGVLQTVGSEKWTQLNPLFNKLLHNRNQDVKKPLADSLHQISQIIGPNYSKQYLFSSLDYVLREPTDSIKLCAIRNLAKFVAQFQTQTRQNLIDVFLVLQKDPKKWRVRFLISNQLKYLSQIYQAETNFKYLFPISLKLCNDQVYEVRKAACEQIVYVINQLKPQASYYKLAIQSIIGYAESQKYLQRQTFCLMIPNLFFKSENFYEHYLKAIGNLCIDEIPIVRIAIAIAIVQIVSHQKNQFQKFQPYIKLLSKSTQVAQYFEDLVEKQEK